MAPRFFSSNLWKEILRDLSPSNTPSGVTTPADCLALVRAGIALIALAIVIDAAESCINARAFSTLAREVPTVWPWLLALHPARLSAAECALIYTTALQFNYQDVAIFADGATWLAYALVRVSSRLVVYNEQLRTAVLAQPDAVALTYDLWEYVASHDMVDAGIDLAMNCLAAVIQSEADQVVHEVTAAGPFGTRLLVRRMHDLCTKPGPVSAGDLANVVNVLCNCARSEILLPHLFRALPSMGRALCVLDETTQIAGPGIRKLVDSAFGRIESLYVFLSWDKCPSRLLQSERQWEDYVIYCCKLLSLLVVKNLTHVRTICRMVRGDLLRGLRICLDRFPNPDISQVPKLVSLIVHELITPAMVFKSVLRAVQRAHTRHPLLHKEGVGHDEWNVMLTNLANRSNLLAESSKREALRACGNPEVILLSALQ
ncbi:hypothetical protein EV714DRAFT_274678 [Schizophyllum commune]